MSKESQQTAAFTIENCPHTKFNGGYQRRCEGCLHTADYIAGYNAATAKIAALRSALEACGTHIEIAAKFAASSRAGLEISNEEWAGWLESCRQTGLAVHRAEALAASQEGK